MPPTDNWFERNEGFITFVGHIAAIKQRNVIIDELAASRTLLQRDQRRKDGQAQRQQRRRDTLYDINQAAKLIEAHYHDHPEQALYESYLLKHTVDEIGLHHSWFSELEWKDQCTETQKCVLRLINTAFSQLSPSEIADVSTRFEGYLAAKRGEDEKRSRKVPCSACRKPILLTTAARTRGKCMRCAKSTGAAWILFLIVAVGIVIVYLCSYLDDQPPPSPGSWTAKYTPPLAKQSTDDSHAKSAGDPAQPAASDLPSEKYVAPPTPAPTPQYRYVLKAPVSVPVPYGAMTVPANTEVRVLRQTANAYRVQSGKLEFDVRSDQLLSIPQ